jgi:hypothetical protein
VCDFDLHWGRIDDQGLGICAGLEDVGGCKGECAGARALKVVQGTEAGVVNCNRRSGGDGCVDTLSSEVVCSLTDRCMRKLARGRRTEEEKNLDAREKDVFTTFADTEGLGRRRVEDVVLGKNTNGLFGWVGYDGGNDNVVDRGNR